jgi:hypothetical protein
LKWDSKPRRAINPRDIEFQTAEIVIPNPAKRQSTITSFGNLYEDISFNKVKMNRLIWGDNLLAMQALLASGYEGKIDLIYIDPPFWTGEDYYATSLLYALSLENNSRNLLPLLVTLYPLLCNSFHCILNVCLLRTLTTCLLLFFLFLCEFSYNNSDYLCIMLCKENCSFYHYVCRMVSLQAA